MLEAVKLMAAVCLVPPDGHEKVYIYYLSISQFNLYLYIYLSMTIDYALYLSTHLVLEAVKLMAAVPMSCTS